MPAIRPCRDPDLRLVATVVTDGAVVQVYEPARRWRERTAPELRSAVMRLLPQASDDDPPSWRPRRAA